MSTLQLIGLLILSVIFLIACLVSWGVSGLDDQGEEIDKRGDE